MFRIDGPPQTPVEWIEWLHARLASRQRQVRYYQKYYDAEEDVLAYAQVKFAREFGSLFKGWRDNFTSLVVDSISERLGVDGFRMGEEQEADSDANEIWQRNFLDADSSAAHISALVAGASYLIVWAGDEGEPTITPESAEHVIVQHKPGSRRELEAALKCYWDDWGTEHVTLWLPGAVYVSERPGRTGSWEEPRMEPNPLGIVPVVPLVNRARLNRHEPYSELQPIIPIQQAITKITADAIVASEFAAYPQRIITGIELEEDEKTGKPVAPIQAAIDRMLLFEEENVSFGQFAAADLQNYVTYVDMLVQHISTISRVPPHYFLVGGAQFPSGESLKAAEAGLVAKAKERMLYFGESWETAMRLAFKVKDDPRAEAFGAETIWADPEHRSDSQRVDALVKLSQGLSVPKRQLWEDYGYTPQQIERFGEMAEEELEQTLARQKALAEVMPQPVPGQPVKPPQGNAGNDNRKNAAGKAA